MSKELNQTNNDVDRRDFLKTILLTVTAFATGELLRSGSKVEAQKPTTAIELTPQDPVTAAAQRYADSKGITDMVEIENIEKQLTAIINSFPTDLRDTFFVQEGQRDLIMRDLGIVNTPSNNDQLTPLDPTAIYPVDEGGATLFATGHLFATVGQANVREYRLDLPWGGRDSKLNHTFHVHFLQHVVDNGAAQVGLDHYPAGSVAASAGSPENSHKYENDLHLVSMINAALNIHEAVNHSSGTNDTAKPNPTVDLWFISADTGSTVVFTVTATAEGDYTWSSRSGGVLQTTEEWLAHSMPSIDFILTQTQSQTQS